MEHMFATKTRYWDQRHGYLSEDNVATTMTLMTLPALANMASQSPFRQELKLIQTQIVARHGIRYPTGGNIHEIYDLLDRLKPFEDLLPAWMKNYTLPYNLSVQGELAVTGKDELRKLGIRNMIRSGQNRPVTYSKEKYRIAHTCVARTRDSAIAFVDSFFENPEDVEYIEYPKDKDVLLRFFDQCPRYQREVKKNQTAQAQLRQFQNSSTMTKVARWLKQSLGLKEESINFSAKDLMTVQSACAFDIALYHHKHHWCSITSKTFIRSLEYLDDLEQFYWIGGGYKINYEMAALLLREIFNAMKEKATGKSTLVGNFFFAHAETTLPLMTLLGYGDRTLLLANATKADIESRGFRSSILSPFAANIEFHLYKRKSSGEDFYVEILINEKEVPIPGCGRILCKLSELERLWYYYLKTYNFDKDYQEAEKSWMTSVVASESFPDLITSPEESNCDTLEQVSDDLPTAPEPLPLGSAVELQVDCICAATLAEVEILQELIEGKQEHQLTVRGRLQLQGGNCQRATACAVLTVETKHCNEHRCFRLQSDTGNQVTLRFELSPDVITNSLPQLEITIRSKRSHKAKFSLSMALGYLLQNLTVGVELQAKIALLDDQDRLCGRLNTRFRGGLLNDLDNSDQDWKTKMHEPVSCILTVKVFEAQVAGTADKDYVANVWSSAGGKLRGQAVSTIVNGGSSTESQSISLQAIDVDTEIFFVGIYRFSSRERNELIGLGRFCVYQLKFPENQTVELCVNLFLESADKELECGSVMLSLQTSSVSTEGEAEKSLSLAATGLGSIAYPVKTGEMKCRLDVGILEVQDLPTNVQVGDCISIQLSVGQTNWKTELAPVKVSVDAGGRMIAIVNENVTSVIRWAAKDRSFPILEVFVYVKRQQKLNRFGIAFKASLATSSHGKRRQAKSTQHNNNVEAPALVASGNLHLSSFFLQQNVSALADLNLDLEKTLVNSADSIPGIMSILLRVRASSSQENGSKFSTSPEYSSHVLQNIKGDICIHLLQASGSSLRKLNFPSSYYVSISTGPQSITSSCCALDDEYTLTWNQQLAIPIACTRPPVIHLTLYSRKADAIQPGTSSDQIIGYLNVPLFPSTLNEDHLLQLELPFGLSASELTKQNNDPHYFKRGLITLEVQFLPTEQPRIGPTPLPTFELVIHQLRGHFLSSEGSQRPFGFTVHVIIEFGILVDRGGVPEELVIGLSRAIELSATGLTEIEDGIDLSNPIIAATLSNGSNNVLVGRIRDLAGKNYGRVHIPLRKDWKERLVNRKKQIWYPVCIESPSGEVTTTTNAVLMSLQLCQQSNQTLDANALGKFHVNICEAIFTSDFASANLMKLGKYGGASIQLTCTSDDPLNATRCRTRQPTDQDSQRWRWENEWFVFTHEEGTSCPQDLNFSLQVSLQTIHPQLEGKLDLLSLVEAAKLRRLDCWVSLADQTQNDDTTVSAHLHVVVSYLPTIIGTLVLDFGENCVLSQPERSLQVENICYKCTFHGASVSTIVPEDQETTNSTSTRLRLPINTRLATTVELPEITIQMMGVTKTLGEICIGKSSIDLLEISELCCLLPLSSESVQVERFIWRELTDKIDQAKTTGIVKLHVEFEEVFATKETTGNGKTREKRGVTSAELFTIWKKLFYLLDQNNNGCIDRDEFTDVFVNHLDVMTGTSDGRKLLQLLFGDEENDTTPTQQQISTLFALMDTNRDNEIQWSEYLRFLQQQISTEDENQTVDIPEVTSKQKRELRRKNREDQCKPPSTESNQEELPPEKTREALPTLQQEPAPPKRSGKVSSSEEKRIKLHYSNQEQSRLQQQVSALESILTIERRRYAELAADRQALMRSYQQLHLKHQNELLQEQTKAKWMKQTIERQQQQLEERERLRRNRNEASIVLQSTVRSRLEQKRYQGLKLQRVNAAVTIQCLIRQVKAKQQFHVLQELARVAKLRTSCASKMQRFIRFHVHRKERSLLVEARTLSATILQKNARRLLAGKTWRAQKIMVLKLQCWVRQRRAIRNLTQRRNAALTVKYAILSWFTRWKYVQKVKSSRKIQNWWRRASVERSVYMTRVEASLCIQSAWKRRTTRKWFEREWLRQEKYIADLEATICIQAAWRGRRRRSKSVGSSGNTPRYNDDSAIEALLYDLVAMIEAGVVIPSILNASTPNETIVGEEAPGDSFVSDAHDLPVSSEEKEADIQVLGVLNDLLETVISADPDGFAESEDDIELPPDESSRDQSCQENGEIGFEQKSNLDDMEKPGRSSSDAVVMTDDNVARDALVHNEIIESLDEESVSIIRNLLEELVEKTTTMAEVAVPHEDSSRNKPLEGFLQDLVGGSERDCITEEGSVAQAVNETVVAGSDAPLVISAEEEVNNSLVEVHENEDVNESYTTNEATRDTQYESDDNSILDQNGHDEVATTVSKLPTELPDVFDTETVEGDLLIPNDSGSDEANSDNEEAGGSSIDSTDLMMEADAMAILQDKPDSETLSVVASAPRHRRTTRLDSLVLLGDVDKLNAQSNPDAEN